MSARAAAAAWHGRLRCVNITRHVQERREKAVKWVDKEVRKLIGQLQKMGRQCSFGQLFAACAAEFEALSVMRCVEGTLVAAKKKGAVNFEGAMLLMGTHDDVVIYLLKDEIADTPLPKPMASGPRVPLNTKSKGFDSETVGVNEKCATCGKTVYPTERLGAASKVFHEQCFVCCQCKGKLKPSDFCSVNGKFYCKPHYTFLFQSKGGYDGMDGGGGKKYGGGGGGGGGAQSPPAAAVEQPKPAPAPTPAPAPVQPTPQPQSPPPRKIPAPAPAPAPAPVQPARPASPPPRRPSPPQPRQPEPVEEKEKEPAAPPERERGGLPFAVPKLRSGGAPRSASASVSSQISQGAQSDSGDDSSAKLPFQAPQLRSVAKKPADLMAGPSPAPSSPVPEKKPFFSAPRKDPPKSEPKVESPKPPARSLSPPRAKEQREHSPSMPPPPPADDLPSPPPQEKKKWGLGGFAAALGFGSSSSPDATPSTRSPSGSEAPPPPPDSRSGSIAGPPSPGSSIAPALSRPVSSPTSAPSLPPRPAFGLKKEPVSPRGAAPPIPQRPKSSRVPVEKEEAPPTPAEEPPRAASPARSPVPVKKAPPPPRSAPVEYKAPPAPEPSSSSSGGGGGSFDISSVGKKYLVPARMILYLRENGTYETDIFRTCFEPDEIKRLDAIMYTPQGATVNLADYSISTVAFCLKRWLRDSDQPLFPYKFFNTLLDIQKNSDGYGKMVRIAEVVMSLPNENRIMLAILFDLLLEIANNSANTGMSSSQLAYTFGPCILRPKDLPTDMRQAMDEAKKINSLLNELVAHSNEVFENVIIPEIQSGGDLDSSASDSYSAPPPAPAATSSSSYSKCPPSRPIATPAGSSGAYSKAAPSSPPPAASSSSPRLPARPIPSSAPSAAPSASPSSPSSSGSYQRALPPPPRTKDAGGKFCTSCGTKNTGRFCTQCGTPI